MQDLAVFFSKKYFFYQNILTRTYCLIIPYFQRGFFGFRNPHIRNVFRNLSVCFEKKNNKKCKKMHKPLAYSKKKQ